MNAVTGVFSYTGAHVARRLLADGEPVRTLSRAPAPDHPLAGEVGFARLQFEGRRALAAPLLPPHTLLTRAELEGLMREALVSSSPSPPAGRRSFEAWLEASAGRLGVAYASEVERNWRR